MSVNPASDTAAEQGSGPDLQAAADDLQPGDTYQEGLYLVFTAQYHLRRGYCCHSGCRHCPYREG